jgi:hypothetical protein
MFADGRGIGVVSGTVAKENVLAYITHTDADEIVVRREAVSPLAADNGAL